MRKTLSKVLLLVTGIFTLAACQPQQSQPAKEQTTVAETTVVETTVEQTTVEEAEQAQVEITIDIYVDGELIDDGSQTIEVEEGAILLDVMKEHFDIEEKDGFISAINGHEQNADENRWWLYDVNGEMAEVGAGDLELAEGDLVEWKLAKLD